MIIYSEKCPSPPLAGFVRKLWYASASDLPHQRERVLPNGCMQIVISLAADTLTDCDGDAGQCRPIAPSILVGARSRFEVIHMRDLAGLVGIVLRPGGAGPWLRQRADAFFERSTALDQIWSDPGLRCQLLQERTPAEKLARLDASLAESLRGREVDRRPLVKAAFLALSRQNVGQSAQLLGVSERRLHQVFCEEVGLSPKLWIRVQRFQRAVHALHSGKELRWDQLALACGYYDQSHFSNDFRAFSGIDPTTYSEHRGVWKNHVALV